MDKLIKASLIASIVTIGGNMETFIKLDWNKIEEVFCMTKEQYIDKDGDEYDYYSGYYIERQVFRGAFTDYIDSLIVNAGGISGKRRKYYYNRFTDGCQERDDLFSPRMMNRFLCLPRANKDKFETTINKMLHSELYGPEDEKNNIDSSDDDEKDPSKDKGSSNNKCRRYPFC